MSNPSVDMLRRTSHAARRYEVSDDRAAQDYQRLVDTHAARGLMYVAGLRTGYLHASLLDVAESHKSECSRPSCTTCASLAATLAMMLAFTRFEIDSEFGQLL